MDPFILTCLIGPVYFDPSIWTLLFGHVYLDPSMWTYFDLSVVTTVVSLWVTKGHHSRYKQVTLNLALVGDLRDSQGITLAPN